MQSITLFANEESRDKVQWTLSLNNMADLWFWGGSFLDMHIYYLKMDKFTYSSFYFAFDEGLSYQRVLRMC